MKTWTCKNCLRKTDTDNNIILIQCICGYPMENYNQLKEDEQGWLKVTSEEKS